MKGIYYFFRWVKWLKYKKPYINYTGYHCGCCGNWVNEKFKVPTYKSCGEWGDTWGLCPICKGGETR